MEEVKPTTLQLITLCGEKGDLWPIMKNLSSFFKNKPDSTVFLSVGKHPERDIEVDIDIFERIGGYVYLLPTSQEDSNYMQNVIKNINGCDASETSEFIKSLETRLINPDTIEVMSHDVPLEKEIKRIPRIDICKIDAAEHTKVRTSLFQILDNGFRPSIIMVRFEHSPDIHVPTQLAAGHLHNAGYILMGVHENKYFYYFTNDCAYDYCSFDEPTLKNPLVDAIIQQTSEGLYMRVCKFLLSKLGEDSSLNNEEFKEDLFKIFFLTRK